jgi:hypothetical protein
MNIKIRYKTKKGYYCNKSEYSFYSKWCKINETDSENKDSKFSKDKLYYNEKDNYYWDYIDSNDKKILCRDNEKCNETDYLFFLKYMVGCVLALFISVALPGSNHLSQTIRLSRKSDTQILNFLLDQLSKQIIETENIDKIHLNNSIQKLKNEIDEIQNNDKTKIGKLIKDVFRVSSTIIKTNTKENIGMKPTSVMDFFINTIPDEHAIEILKGGNFVTFDNGKLYESTKTTMEGYGRFSSHESNEIQYGFTDIFVDSYLHLLCGENINKDGKKYSWCQFEGAPMPPGLTTVEVFKNIYDGNNFNKQFLQFYIDHFVDSAYYFALSKTLQIIGKKGFNLALGTSEHTDNNPIIIEKISKEEFENEPQDRIPFNFIKNNFTKFVGLHDDLILDNNSNETLPSTTKIQSILTIGTINSQNNPQYYSTSNQFLQMPQNSQIAGGKTKKQRKSRKQRKNRKNKTQMLIKKHK